MYKHKNQSISFIIEKVFPLLSYIIFIAILSFTWYLEQDKIQNHVFIRNEKFFAALFDLRYLTIERIIVFIILIVGIVNVSNERKRIRKTIFTINNKHKALIIYNIFMVLVAFLSLVLLFTISYVKTTTIFVVTASSLVMLAIEVIRVIYVKW